mmetsp:Transcript_7723/g.14614  ORF Transcript_7723/g.14614 Transcript_7723/m.14614 type:complete len:104 (+) Transcript_7723:1969-2280(+)
MLDSLSSVPQIPRDLVFRNYVPRHNALKEFVVPAPTIVGETEMTVERAIHQTLEEFAQEAPIDIVPRKPNWDLKRELSQKLAKLQVATDRAIVELVRRSVQKG